MFLRGRLVSRVLLAHVTLVPLWAPQGLTGSPGHPLGAPNNDAGSLCSPLKTWAAVTPPLCTASSLLSGKSSGKDQPPSKPSLFQRMRRKNSTGWSHLLCPQLTTGDNNGTCPCLEKKKPSTSWLTIKAESRQGGDSGSRHTSLASGLYNLNIKTSNPQRTKSCWKIPKMEF